MIDVREVLRRWQARQRAPAMARDGVADRKPAGRYIESLFVFAECQAQWGRVFAALPRRSWVLAKRGTWSSRSCQRRAVASSSSCRHLPQRQLRPRRSCSGAAGPGAGRRGAPPAAKADSTELVTTLGWVAGGVGVAGIITGSVAGILVLHRKNIVDHECAAEPDDTGSKSCSEPGSRAARSSPRDAGYRWLRRGRGGSVGGRVPARKRCSPPRRT